MQEVESAYGNVLGKVPSSGKKKCSSRRLVFILMGLTITMLLLLMIVAAFLFVMYFHTFEGRKTIEQSISQMTQNVPDKSCGSCWKKFDGSCYYFEVNRMTWIEAHLSCKRMDSDLVIINSDIEQKFLHSKTGDDLYWIGLEKIRDVWTWVDGTILKASSGFWQTGEPNNKHGNEKCTHLSFEGKMNDARCDDVEYKCRAICEKKNIS
ncbi:hepatic lectin-like isoform X1 [Xenopus laevis]|uniref:Hepatic lectin-like isoform X1 n=2 Tax=Xenopus laevis TaxID=8355 RepID=A0A1L8H2G5_XENLA|nr:hepatic lectin-like isoform X1 [Xenopus laevis]OCT90290.1 hypothetical protein XELAEV_18018901mg [Xenopus laevis]